MLPGGLKKCKVNLKINILSVCLKIRNLKLRVTIKNLNQFFMKINILGFRFHISFKGIFQYSSGLVPMTCAVEA